MISDILRIDMEIYFHGQFVCAPEAGSSAKMYYSIQKIVKQFMSNEKL